MPRCPRGFRCRYGACVSRESRCNGIYDCADGSDEDELLCGAHLEFNLVKANATGNIPAGSCRLPTRSDVRFDIYEVNIIATLIISHADISTIFLAKNTSLEILLMMENILRCYVKVELP